MNKQPQSQAAREIFEVAKAGNDVYLAAYRTGYEAGWTAAMKKAMEILSQPITKDKP